MPSAQNPENRTSEYRALPYALRETRYGRMLYHERDTYIGQSFARYGVYGEIELQLLRALVKPGDVVVEAGANIGADTVPLARRIGERGAIFAFEPQRLVYQMLCANVALNGLSNVIAYCKTSRGHEHQGVRSRFVAFGPRTLPELCLFAYWDRRCRDTPQRLWYGPRDNKQISKAPAP